MSFLSIFIGDPNQRFVDGLKPVIDKINSLESEAKNIPDEDFPKKTEALKERLKKGETLDDILPEAFALAREAARRTLGQRHFDVQLVGGIVLHQGKIAEMKTGEGKTLTATLAVYLNALSGEGAHLVTVNDYLARRDTNWMGAVYHFLGLSIGCLNHEKAYLFDPHLPPDEMEATVEMENLREVERREAYRADITYGTNNEFGFDYLRDNMVARPEQLVQREHIFSIVDEVDSILIDEARTPLIISAPDEESGKMYQQFARIIPRLKENSDYNIDEKMRAATLTEEGIIKVEQTLGMENIYEEQNIRLVHHLEQALRAQALFKLDRDYVVKDGEVIIVDEFTGRLMPGRRYSDGLHQAIEAKEGVAVQRESRTLATITFQNYFRLYKKLSGMTGTAATNAEEFHKVYNLDVLIIPTNKPTVREDLSDSVYRTDKGKWMAVIKEIKKRREKGQPTLVGTVSVEKNEKLSALLSREGIPHEILNAKNHEREALIIAQAGQAGAVTVATNMAGRGVDIILGGKPYNREEYEKIKTAGGLHVIGTERHEARRIDNQLRGRCGRQGDPGSSQFFVSLEDDLMRVFGSDRLKSFMERSGLPEDYPIENRLVTKAIEAAQFKIEGFHFDTRKYVLEYDDVMNKQRTIIYKRRREIMETAPDPERRKEIREKILEIFKKEIGNIVDRHTGEASAENWDAEEIVEAVGALVPLPPDAHSRVIDIFKTSGDPEREVKECLSELALSAYAEKEKEVGKDTLEQIGGLLMLRTIDSFWMDHLDEMEHLRDSVRLRAYGQRDPLIEYKNEGHHLFQDLLGRIDASVAGTILKVTVKPREQTPIGTEQARQLSAGAHKEKVGRNDPCPCGAKKSDGTPIKYKHCHGK